MAEGILKEKLKQRGIDAMVDSAGTSGWHEGELPDDRATETCQRYGIDITDQRSRPFDVSDFDQFDLIFAMDQENYKNLLRLTDDVTKHERVKMIMNEVKPGSNLSVPDPYYGGDDGFEMVFSMLDEASDAIINTYFPDASAE